MKASIQSLALALAATALACHDSVSSDSGYSNVPANECDPTGGNAVCDCAGDDDCPPGFHCQITDASLRDICVPDDQNCQPDPDGTIGCCNAGTPNCPPPPPNCDPDSGACPPPPPGCNAGEPNCPCSDPTACPPPPDDVPGGCPAGDPNCNDN